MQRSQQLIGRSARVGPAHRPPRPRAAPARAPANRQRGGPGAALREVVTNACDLAPSRAAFASPKQARATKAGSRGGRRGRGALAVRGRTQLQRPAVEGLGPGEHRTLFRERTAKAECQRLQTPRAPFQLEPWTWHLKATSRPSREGKAGPRRGRCRPTQLPLFRQGPGPTCCSNQHWGPRDLACRVLPVRRASRPGLEAGRFVPQQTGEVAACFLRRLCI